ncbi:MAG: 50S ribosomal protein L9 [Coxiellaceae bacterium]|jgi:large subunit ribosomal protein L9|nr:50S ribosomal protein L9 [Coxiellaceae bacterium]
MEVILLEKIRNLGDVGVKVDVRSGHARNYLIPYGKAVLATKNNLEKFSRIHEELEKKASETLMLAKKRADSIGKTTISIPVKVTEDGRLFGSINTSTIVHALKDAGFEVKKSEISMPNETIRQIGEYHIVLLLHSDVTVKVKVNVIPS